MTRDEILTDFETRLRAKFTPALNTGSAMDALQLVGETIRELREVTAHSQPETVVSKEVPRPNRCGVYFVDHPGVCDLPVGHDGDHRFVSPMLTNAEQG